MGSAFHLQCTRYSGTLTPHCPYGYQAMGHLYLYLIIPYFFDYKTESLSFLNNPKNLDPSYKMDLDLGDCLGRIDPIL